jgi:hypothetical protein
MINLFATRKVPTLGISNWTLDPAKMNRAVCLQRPDPDVQDLTLLGTKMGKNSLRKEVVEKLANLHKYITRNPEVLKRTEGLKTMELKRDFFGMRDYYHLIKYLQRQQQPNHVQLAGGVQPNAGRTRGKSLGRKRSSWLRNMGMGSSRKLSNNANGNTNTPTGGATSGGRKRSLPSMWPSSNPTTSRSNRSMAETITDDEKVMVSICRNFGGHKLLLRSVLNESKCKEGILRQQGDARLKAIEEKVSIPNMVRQNLQDEDSRHLMLLTENGAALRLLFDCGLLKRLRKGTPTDEDDARARAHAQNLCPALVLEGSPFKDDTSDLDLLKDVNKVKNAMRAGDTIVLFQCE